MAKSPTFQIEDIERLFRALVPTGGADPFGRIEELLVKAAEIEALQTEGTDEYREEVFDELSSIKSRTFGILLLQIFRTIKFFFGLLPQGRIILLLVAGLSLASTVMEGGKPSLADVRAAVASTGIGAYIDKVMEELKVTVNELADDTFMLADVASVMFIQFAGGLENILGNVSVALAALGEVATTTIEDEAKQVITQADLTILTNALNDALAKGDSMGNMSSNAENLIGPALRALDKEIRKIPELANELVKL